MKTDFGNQTGRSSNTRGEMEKYVGAKILKFTAIELLVVIAVLSILAGLLLPSLAKAKQVVLREQCRSHQEQLNFVFLSYAIDNENQMISNWTTQWGAVIRWPYFVSGSQELKGGLGDAGPEYVNIGNQVYGCPANPAYDSIMSKHGTSNYAYGMYEVKSTDNPIIDEDFYVNDYPSGGTKPWIQTHFLNRVKKTSQIVWLADSATTRNWGGQPSDHRQIARFYRNKGGGWTERIHLQHFGKANVLFYDGHVEDLDQYELSNGAAKLNYFFTEDFQAINF